MLLCTDAETASAALASGELACPSCHAGRLRPWGHGRERGDPLSYLYPTSSSVGQRLRPQRHQ